MRPSLLEVDSDVLSSREEPELRQSDPKRLDQSVVVSESELDELEEEPVSEDEVRDGLRAWCSEDTV